MLMGTQPGDISVSVIDFKSCDVVILPPICTVTNGGSAHPPRCWLIGHTENTKGEQSAPYSLKWHLLKQLKVQHKACDAGLWAEDCSEDVLKDYSLFILCFVYRGVVDVQWKDTEALVQNLAPN